MDEGAVRRRHVHPAAARGRPESLAAALASLYSLIRTLSSSRILRVASKPSICGMWQSCRGQRGTPEGQEDRSGVRGVNGSRAMEMRSSGVVKVTGAK